MWCLLDKFMQRSQTTLFTGFYLQGDGFTLEAVNKIDFRIGIGFLSDPKMWFEVDMCMQSNQFLGENMLQNKSPIVAEPSSR